MLTRSEARNVLRNCGIPLDADFHTLSTSEVESILEAADEYKYRKPRNANGSRGRYFHAYLSRVAQRKE